MFEKPDELGKVLDIDCTVSMRHITNIILEGHDQVWADVLGLLPMKLDTLGINIIGYPNDRQSKRHLVWFEVLSKRLARSRSGTRLILESRRFWFRQYVIL